MNTTYTASYSRDWGRPREPLSLTEKLALARQKQMQDELAIRKNEEFGNKIAQSKAEELKMKIADAQSFNQNLKVKLQKKQQKLEDFKNEKDEDVQKIDARIAENGKRCAKLQQEFDKSVEYSGLIGHLVKALKVDYKTKPGSCLCPEGKICVSSTGAKIECEFWNCPLLNPPTDDLERTITRLKI